MSYRTASTAKIPSKQPHLPQTRQYPSIEHHSDKRHSPGGCCQMQQGPSPLPRLTGLLQLTWHPPPHSCLQAPLHFKYNYICLQQVHRARSSGFVNPAKSLAMS